MQNRRIGTIWQIGWLREGIRAIRIDGNGIVNTVDRDGCSRPHWHFAGESRCLVAGGVVTYSAAVTLWSQCTRCGGIGGQRKRVVCFSAVSVVITRGIHKLGASHANGCGRTCA